MSLYSIAERLAAIDRSTVVLDTQKCLHAQDKLSACEACFAVCPVEAIQPGKPPAIETESCQACLACLPVCPVGAYTADDAVPSLLTCVTRLDGKSIELLCEVHDPADLGVSPDSAGIRIKGCLAGLGSGAYMALAAMGLEQIMLWTDACAQCPWGSLHKNIEEQVAKTNRLLTPWQKTKLLTCLTEIDGLVERPLLDAENPPLSRRDLFRMAARQGQAAIARAMTMERGAGNRRPGRDRVRMIEAVSHLPQINENLELEVRIGGFADLSVSTECSACRACVQACPTNSLEFKMDAEEKYYWLQFTSKTCIDCQHCVHVCAPGAISINQKPTFAEVFYPSEPITLSEGELEKCGRCAALFPARSGSNLCLVCDYRKKNPFGSMLPSGVKKFVDQSKGEGSRDP